MKRMKRGQIGSRLLFFFTLLLSASLIRAQGSERYTSQFQPIWSPDGQYYACFEKREGNTQVTIYAYNSHNRPDRPKKTIKTIFAQDDMFLLFSGEEIADIIFFDWAHDSRHYVFLSASQTATDLFVGQLSSNTTWRLTDDTEAESVPRWSPDDRYIVYVKAGDLHAIKMDPKTKKPIKDANGKTISGQLTNDPDIQDLYPEWNPAKKYDYELAFSRLFGGNPPFSYNIAVYKAGGFELQFAQQPNDETSLEYVTLDNAAHELHPVYSPNGRRLAFYVIAKGELNYYLYTIDLYIQTSPVTDLKAKYSSIKKLSSLSVLPSMFMGPSWSFDSRNIAFVENKLPYYPIHVVEVEHRQEMKSDTLGQFANLGKGYSQNSDVAWAPNNYDLAFISRNAKTSLKELLIKDASETTRPRRIALKFDAVTEMGESIPLTQMPSPRDNIIIKVEDKLARAVRNVSVRVELDGKTLPLQKTDETGEARFAIPELVTSNPSLKLNVKVIKDGKDLQISSPGAWPISFQQLERRTPGFYLLRLTVFK